MLITPLSDDRLYYYRNGDNTSTNTSEIIWDQNQAHEHSYFDSPTGRIFDLLLTDDDSGSASVTDISRDVNADEPNTKTAKPMAKKGGSEVLVRSINKIAQIRI